MLLLVSLLASKHLQRVFTACIANSFIFCMCIIGVNDYSFLISCKFSLNTYVATCNCERNLKWSGLEIPYGTKF